MALRPCRECHVEISTDAKTCPHCGHRSPHATGGLRWFLILTTVLSVLITAGIISLAGISDNSGSGKPAKVETGCKVVWSKCVDNADLANNYSGWTRVKADCKLEADKLARYGDPKWPWGSFESFYVGDNYAKKGIAYAIEREAQFQNGYGAWARVEVVCQYDLNAKKVTNVSINQR
jgi:hypothetical protein